MEWSTLRQIGNSRLVRLSGLFPFVGYIILLNDNVAEFLNFSTKYVSFHVSTPGARLYLLFFGLLLTGVGSLIYEIFCPLELKKYARPADYMSAEISIVSEKRAEDMAHFLGGLHRYHLSMTSPDNFRMDVMRDMFYYLSKSKPLWRIVATILFSLEYFSAQFQLY